MGARRALAIVRAFRRGAPGAGHAGREALSEALTSVRARLRGLLGKESGRLESCGRCGVHGSFQSRRGRVCSCTVYAAESRLPSRAGVRPFKREDDSGFGCHGVFGLIARSCADAVVVAGADRARDALAK